MERALSRGVLGLAIMMSVLVPASAPHTTVLTLDLERVPVNQLVKLKKEVWRVRGVRTASLDLSTGKLVVRHTKSMSPNTLQRAIARASIGVLHAELDGQVCRENARLACTTWQSSYARRSPGATRGRAAPPLRSRRR